MRSFESDNVIISLFGLRDIDETDIQHINLPERDLLHDTPGLIDYGGKWVIF
jgi:hypothetical protein